MAEENPHIEIKSPVKPISSSREQYLFENENLILGNAGFIFRIYPTLKERLAKILEEQKLNSRIAKSKSMAQMFPKIKYSGSLNQPILRFKNRTGLERILEIVQQHCKPEEEESIKKIREKPTEEEHKEEKKGKKKKKKKGKAYEKLIDNVVKGLTDDKKEEDIKEPEKVEERTETKLEEEKPKEEKKGKKKRKKKGKAYEKLVDNVVKGLTDDKKQ